MWVKPETRYFSKRNKGLGVERENFY